MHNLRALEKGCFGLTHPLQSAAVGRYTQKISRRGPISRTHHPHAFFAKRTLPPAPFSANRQSGLPAPHFSPSHLDRKLATYRKRHFAFTGARSGPHRISQKPVDCAPAPVLSKFIRHQKGLHALSRCAVHSPVMTMFGHRKESVCTSLADRLAYSMMIKTPRMPQVRIVGSSPILEPCIPDDSQNETSPVSSPTLSEFSLFSEQSSTSSKATTLTCVKDEEMHTSVSTSQQRSTSILLHDAPLHNVSHTHSAKVYLASAPSPAAEPCGAYTSRIHGRRNALAPASGPARTEKSVRKNRTLYMGSSVSREDSGISMWRIC